MSPPRDSGGARWGALVVLGATLALAPALRNGFVWDDSNNLVGSDRLHQWNALWQVFLRPAMWSAELSTGPIGTYRPLALASFALDYRLYGMAPLGYHLTSILLHGGAMLVVYRLLRRLLGSPRIACAITLVPAVHPACVEAVGWINGRSEVLALLFGVGALSAVERDDRLRDLGWAALSALGSLLGKESGVAFLALAVLLAGMPRAGGDPPRWRAAARTAAAMALAGLAYAALRTIALGPSTLPAQASWRKVLGALPAVFIRCFRGALFPYHRSLVVLDRWLAHLGTAEWMTYAVATLALLGLIVFLVARRRYLTAFGLLWWLLSLVPVAWVAIAPWPGLGRWLYIGMPGLALAVGTGLAAVASPRLQAVVAAVAIAVALVLTERALPVWRSSARLYSVMIEEEPDQPWPYLAFGQIAINSGDVDGAERLFELAIELGTTDHAAYGYLAFARAQKGRCEEAVHMYITHPQELLAPWRFLLAAADCHLRKHEIERARILLARCADMSPACVHALAGLPPAPRSQ